MKSKNWIILGGLVTFCLIIGMAFYFGQASPIFLRGKAIVAPELRGDLGKISTVFVIITDPKSDSPRPLAAYREVLRRPIKGDSYNFTLTPENTQIMGDSSANPDGFMGLPVVINVKIRFDQDGAAGPDSSGDLTGDAQNIVLGTKDLEISVKQKTP